MRHLDMTNLRRQMGWSKRKLARELGMSPTTVQSYEDGRTRIPRHVALACSALICKLEPWPLDH